MVGWRTARLKGRSYDIAMTCPLFGKGMSAVSRSDTLRQHWATLTPEQRAARTAAADKAARARVERFRAAGIDPEIAEAWLAEQIARAPRLTDDQVQRLAGLLSRKVDGAA